MDKANVSDKDKVELADVENNAANKKMDEKRDEQSEKMEHESEGNRKGNSDLMFFCLCGTYVSFRNIDINKYLLYPQANVQRLNAKGNHM